MEFLDEITGDLVVKVLVGEKLLDFISKNRDLPWLIILAYLLYRFLRHLLGGVWEMERRRRSE